jgi:hypothetical protein
VTENYHNGLKSCVAELGLGLSGRVLAYYAQGLMFKHNTIKKKSGWQHLLKRNIYLLMTQSHLS